MRLAQQMEYDDDFDEDQMGAPVLVTQDSTKGEVQPETVDESDLQARREKKAQVVSDIKDR